MVSMRKISVIALATTGALALTACAHGGGSAQAYQTPGFHPFGGGRPKPGPVAPIGVNGYLWRASLDTLAFMPLSSADPYGGVIITDWYVPPATPDERFKVNAYILSTQMTADAIKVSVFRQVQQDGQWVDAPADPALAGGLEDRILAQAANLQAAAQNNK